MPVALKSVDAARLSRCGSLIFLEIDWVGVALGYEGQDSGGGGVDFRYRRG